MCGPNGVGLSMEVHAHCGEAREGRQSIKGYAHIPLLYAIGSGLAVAGAWWDVRVKV